MTAITTTDVPAPEGVTASNLCSDVSNGQRVAHHFGDELRYVPGLGWMTWGGGPWRQDDALARRYVHILGSHIAQEVPAIAAWAAAARGDPEEQARREKILAARLKWAGRSEQTQRIDAALKEAQVYLQEDAGRLDSDPELLGCRNGVVELHSGSFRQHRRGDFVTKVTGCDYAAGAICPRWERFVAEVFGEDAELIDWTQRLLGYCLSGMRDEHILPIAWGSGANGKSTMFDTLLALLGDYAGPAAPGLLMQHYHADHPTNLADLQGKRLVVANESGEGGRLNEELIKSLTGGDKIKARHMRQDFFEFAPSHQLFLLTNHKPSVRGGDHGIWRRLRLVPFAIQFDGERRDTGLKQKLLAELPGILNWCVAGYRAYTERGLGDEPAAVRVATEDYRDGEDVVRRFVAECCDVDSMRSARGGELYASYRAWAEAAGEHPLPQRRFAERLGQAGFVKERSGGVVYRGIGLRH